MEKKDYGPGRTPLKLHLQKGALHADLGVPQGENIPAKKLAIKPGDSALEKKRKQFAINAKRWNHKGA